MFHYPAYFSSYEWLGQYIESGTVQDLGPQMLVRESRDHNQRGRKRQRLNRRKNIQPVSIWQVPLGNHYVKAAITQKFGCRTGIRGAHELAVQACKNLSKIA
ncbi:MAG TPA: hypothetical protein VKY31_14450 [Terriglobia bacterium]|nr:hypothetical protein [Terriglobia bacterium]